MNPAVPCGVLYVDKPVGMTSHDVVNRIRKAYMTRQVGHTGTLDPIASGVLTVLVGRAVKASEYLTADSKDYEAVFRLGVRTDSGDATGKILSHTDEVPGLDRVKAAAEFFKGEIIQIPPMYSSVKINGKKLVDLARKGMTVEREGRKVRVYELNVAPSDTPGEYRMFASVSKGTYIRTLITDIGDVLGCGACMTYLRRVRCGTALLSSCRTLEAVEEAQPQLRASFLLPVETVFEDCERLALPPFFERLARDGNEIYLSKLGVGGLAAGQKVRLYGEKGFFALGEIREYENGPAAKPIKRFDPIE